MRTSGAGRPRLDKPSNGKQDFSHTPSQSLPHSLVSVTRIGPVAESLAPLALRLLLPPRPPDGSGCCFLYGRPSIPAPRHRAFAHAKTQARTTSAAVQTSPVLARA